MLLKPKLNSFIRSSQIIKCTDTYYLVRLISITLVLSKVFEQQESFVLDDLWNAVMCFQPNHRD